MLATYMMDAEKTDAINMMQEEVRKYCHLLRKDQSTDDLISLSVLQPKMWGFRQAENLILY